jgi:hypothetical protein
MPRNDGWGGVAGKRQVLDNLRAREGPARPGVPRYGLAERGDGDRVSWPVDANGRGYEFGSRAEAERWLKIAKTWGLLPGDEQRLTIVRVTI